MGLRYFFIPLAVLLYLWWSFRSIREIVTESRKEQAYSSFSDSTSFYMFTIVVKIFVLFCWGLIELVGLIVKYW